MKSFNIGNKLGIRPLRRLVLILFLLPLLVMGRDEGVNVRMQGEGLQPGSQLLVEDNKYFYMEIHDPLSNPSDAWTSDFVNKNVLNKITLGVDESKTGDLGNDFSYVIYFEVDLWRYENGAWVQSTETGLSLRVDYTAGSGINYDRDMVSYENVHRSVIRVTGISDASGAPISDSHPAVDALYLQSDIEVDRYYYFDPTYVPSINGFLQEKSVDNHLQVYWDYLREAEWYDLEWTFVDHFSGHTNQDWVYDFDAQATRVRVHETKYELPIVFDEGYVLFRYRPVYASPMDGGLPVEGRWTTHGVGGSGLVSNYASNAVHQISPSASSGISTESLPHESSMNWQYSAVYSENSRSSHTMSYSDGLDKVRQQIAALPTKDQTAATSAVYDYTGRPTVQMLPVPIQDKKLQYFHGLNQINTGSGSEPFSAKHFDDDDTYLDNLGSETECEIDFKGLSTSLSLGAARYFSDQNTDQEGMQAYVPSSQDGYGSDNSYPFTLIQYMPDHTGRVKRQTGVGSDLTLGSGHENRIYYDQPLPGELSYFFQANDIGDINSYRRVISKDPNGQISFQYLNNFDKVVISSLSPQNPEAYLPVNPGAANGVSDLLEYATDEEPLTVSLTRFVEQGEQVYFRYYLDPQAYQDGCINNSSVCFDCLYDLELNFSYVDECGDDSPLSAMVPSGQLNVPFSTSVGDANYFNTLCEAPLADLYEYPSGANTGTFTNAITMPKTGYLTITKTIRVKPSAAEEYADLYLNELEIAKENGQLNSSCDFKTKEEWICEQLTGMSSEIDDCQSYDCEDQFVNEMISTYQDEYNQYVAIACEGTDPGCEVDDFATYMGKNYNTLYNQYMQDCNNPNLTALNPCRIYKDALKADFYPGGQYAQYDVTNSGGTSTYSTTDNTSIFHTSPASPLVNYQSITYDPATYPIINGVAKDPATMDVDEFILNFNPLWADVLYTTHPEYCYVQFCEANPTYFSYEAKMLEEDDYQLAVNKGLFKPQNTSVCSGGSLPTMGTTDYDPFTAGGTLTSYMNNMSVAGISGGSGVCVWEAALESVHYDPDNPSAPLPSAYGTEACLKDREWIAFRSFYLMGRKALMDDTFFSQYPSCYNSNSKLNAPFNQKQQRITFVDFANPNYGNLQDHITAQQWSFVNGTGGATPTTAGMCDVCDDHALAWESKLQDCAGNSTDIANAVEAIRLLCVYQCQTNVGGNYGFDFNAFGATTIANYSYASVDDKGSYTAPTSGASLTVSGSTFFAENVDDILRHYFGASWREFDCNAFMINNPGPYGQNDNTRYLDDCGCSVIATNTANFTNLQSLSQLPNGVETESELFAYTYGHIIPDYNYLKCQCPLTGAALLAKRLPFPEEFMCNTCIACDEMDAVVNDFNSYFGLTTIDDWTDPVTFPGVFTHFVNVRLTENLGANANGDVKLSFGDYSNLINDCEAYCSNQLIAGDNLTEYAYEIQEFLNDLVNDNKLITGSAHPIPKYYDFYRNNLYECLFNGTEDVSTEVVTNQSGSNFTITVQLRDLIACGSFIEKDIDLTCTSCPSGVTLSDIVSFDYITADFTSTVVAGDHYDFQIEALLSNGNTVVFDQSYTHENGSPSTKHYPVYSSITTASPTYCSGSGSYTGFMPQLCYPGLKYKERDPCTDDIIERGLAVGEQLYEEAVADLREDFKNNYTAFCEGDGGSVLDEVFELQHNVNNSYVMLYKYDHLGNLVETIPPEGVDLTGTKQHKMSTEYQFNSRNQFVQQKMPDHGYENVGWEKGATRFAYNGKTQVVLSQNEEQRYGKDIGGTMYPGYSYVLYDGLGRVVESGLVYGIYNDGSSSANLVDESQTKKAQEILNHADFPGNISGTSQGGSWVVQERLEVTRTRFDISLDLTMDQLFEEGQQNLLNRIASICYNEVHDSDPLIYNSAIHYSYDEVGNVDKLINDYPSMENTGNRFKTVDYTFDLVSGNVKEVAYQSGEKDAYYHRYIYDQDNRLREAFTSSDYLHWDRDVDYKYYNHGSLGRMELGDLKVQGEDALYTLQGWIKGKNAADMESHRDGGKDGDVGSAYFSSEGDLHTHFAEDAASLGLVYNNGDYRSIKNFTSSPDDYLFPQFTGSSYTDANFKSLYNGSIGGRLHQTRNVSGAKNRLWAARYRYDQLNRLKEANYHYGNNLFGSNGNYSESQLVATTDYLSTYVYDLNGNIEALFRNGYASQALSMDDIDYYYPESGGRKVNNRLRGVNDAVSAANYDVDIDHDGESYGSTLASSSDNFDYDRIGNLIKDESEYIANIEWTNSGRVKRITRNAVDLAADNQARPDMEFEYDAMGNRIRKTVKPRLTDGSLQNELYWTHTYYQRDAQGNVMATYESTMTQDDETHGEFCYVTPNHTFYDPSRINRWYITFTLVNSQIVTTAPVVINGSDNASLYQALADAVNALQVQDLYAVIIDDCIHIFSYCLSPTSPASAVIHYEYEDGDGGIELNEPFIIQLQCKFKREQFKLADHHMYGSSRLGIEERDVPIFDYYFEYSSIDPETKALVGKTHLEEHPTFRSYECEAFSGYCLLNISGGSGVTLPSVDLGDGINIFEGETWTGIGGASGFVSWLIGTYIPAHPELKLEYSTSGLSSNQIKLGKKGMTNQNGKHPTIIMINSSIYMETFGDGGSTDPKTLAFAEGYDSWEACEGERIAGNKRFELVDHLGNVQTVVSDQKIINNGNTIYTDYFDTETPGWNWQSNFSITQGRAKIKTYTQFYQFRKNFDVDPNSVYTIGFDIERDGTFGNNMMVLVYDLDNGGQLNSIYIPNDGSHKFHIMTPNTSRIRLVFQRNSPSSYGLETFYVDNVEIAKNEEVYGGEFVSPIYNDWIYHEAAYTVSNNGRIYVQSSTPGHGMQKQFTGLDDEKTYKIRCKINPYQLGQMNIKIYSGGTAPSDVILDEDFATVYGSYREWDVSPAMGYDWVTVVITRVTPTAFSQKLFIMEEFTITEGVNSILPDQFIADIISTNDYYPFGMLKPGEQYSSPEYKYGFNGFEKDDEVKGSGNSHTTEFRQYDARLGRWMSIDPLSSHSPDWTPYRFGFNNPIRMADPNGAYEADGSLSEKETSDIKQKHKDSGAENWKENAQNEIDQKVAENVAAIEKSVNEAQTLLESNSDALDAFEALTGTKKGDDDYNNFFENNGEGISVKITDLNISGFTDKYGNVTLSSSGHDDFTLSVTILHEYIHSASNQNFIKGDGTKKGYKNLVVNGRQIPLQEQMNALDIARQAAKPDLVPAFNEVYTDAGNIENGKDTKVEGGYLFEILGFGKVTHQKHKQREK